MLPDRSPETLAIVRLLLTPFLADIHEVGFRMRDKPRGWSRGARKVRRAIERANKAERKYLTAVKRLQERYACTTSRAQES